MFVPTSEFIQENYETTTSLLPEELRTLFDALGERYATCPASSRAEYFSAFPGGLCYHNLHVLKWVSRFSAAAGEKEFDAESLKKVVFLHSLGKVGTLDADYYLDQESDWHRNKGIYYEINPELQYMKVPQRSLWLAQNAGIKLTEEEYLSILLSDGQYDDTNSPYKYKEPKLAIVVQNAIQWARKIEKDSPLK